MIKTILSVDTLFKYIAILSCRCKIENKKVSLKYSGVYTLFI